MSMPTFPNDGIDLTKEQALNMLLGSIAMEELALSHIMNAEGEKLQYALGTLSDKEPICTNCNDILKINKSISELLEQVNQSQFLLKSKLTKVLDAIEYITPCEKNNNCCNNNCIKKTEVLTTQKNFCLEPKHSIIWKSANNCNNKYLLLKKHSANIYLQSNKNILVNFSILIKPCKAGKISFCVDLFKDGALAQLYCIDNYALSADMELNICGSFIVTTDCNYINLDYFVFNLCSLFNVVITQGTLTLTEF